MFGTDCATLLSQLLHSHLHTVLKGTGNFLSLLLGLVLPQKIVGNAKNFESLSINIPNGLLPSPGAKFKTFSKFSVISDCCSKVSV